MMIRRGNSGHVEEFRQAVDNGDMVFCNACSHASPKVNLKDGGKCPFCHYDVRTVIDNDVASDNRDEDIARPC